MDIERNEDGSPERLEDAVRLYKEAMLLDEALGDKPGMFIRRYDTGEFFNQPFKFFYLLSRKLRSIRLPEYG